MNSTSLLIITICAFVLAYRYYAAFIASKVLMLSKECSTPATELNDGRDYIPTHKWIVFGQHFAAIAGAGPLIGPVLAAQYGWGPAFFWIILGSVFAGAVHDMIILFASIRYKGKSISTIANEQVSQITGLLLSFLVLFIIIITIAGVASAVVNALHENPWSTATITFTIPIAMVVGIYLFKTKNPNMILGTTIGILLTGCAVLFGPYVVESAIGSWFNLNKQQISILLPIYGFFTAALPTWLLLTPRGYLSTYMKIGIVAILAIGLFFVNPSIEMPFTTEFLNGGGPVVKGPWWPYVFIIIACGAISGFHALISSGTTPKLVADELHIKAIGYGAMLVEGFVAMMALFAVVTLNPADYFAINSSAVDFANLGISPVGLPQLNEMIGVDVSHRPGGAISLAVGMANIFANFNHIFKDTMPYWFQLIIMFEAIFILTLIDSGTRVARYMTQNALANIYKPLGDTSSTAATVFASIIVSFCWGYLLYTGDISSLWTLFGATNQALAAMVLAICTTLLLRLSAKRIYALITFIPGVFIFITALAASYMNLWDYYQAEHNLNIFLSLMIISITFIVIADNVRCWVAILGGNDRLAKSDNKLIVDLDC